MKAMILRQFGDIHHLRYEELPVPESGRNTLVQIHYAAVNPYDWKFIEHLGAEQGAALPVIPGSEFSGIIAQAPENSSYKPGDRVCGNLSTYGGCYAEYIQVPDTEIARVPDQLDLQVAAAIPVAMVLARKVLFEDIGLLPGETILIHGASGAVGAAAVQLAKKAGARVIATSSRTSRHRVEHLGADQVIDYKNENFEDQIQGIDAVLDTVGGRTQERSFQVLKNGGRLISLVQPPDQQLAVKTAVRAAMVFGRTDTASLRESLELVNSEAIQIAIEQVFPLVDAITALKTSKKGGRTGKILLKLTAD